MTNSDAIATYRAARFTALAESLRIAANARDGFNYSGPALVRAGSAPAGIVGR